MGEDLLLVLLRRPEPGDDLDARLAGIGARPLGADLYLVRDVEGAAESLHDLARAIRRRGGRALIGRGGIV